MSRGVDGTYVHHLGVTSPIRAVKQVQHILLELLAVSVDVFSRLDDRLNEPLMVTFDRRIDIPCQSEAGPLPSQL